jgi:hypothetical protein
MSTLVLSEKMIVFALDEMRVEIAFEQRSTPDEPREKLKVVARPGDEGLAQGACHF